MNSMYFNQYSVKVTPGREVQDGYVLLRHGDVYTLTLRNDRDVRCDVYVTIDGQPVIGVRLNAHQSTVIDGPTDEYGRNKGRLTFYRAGSSEFHQVNGHNVPARDQGLVSVTFKPEKERQFWTNQILETGNKTPSPFRGGSIEDRTSLPPYSTSAQWKAGDSNEVAYAAASGPIASASGPLMRGTKGLSAGATGLTGQSSQEFNKTQPLENMDQANERTINLRLAVDDDAPRPLTTKSTPIPPPVGNWR